MWIRDDKNNFKCICDLCGGDIEAITTLTKVNEIYFEGDYSHCVSCGNDFVNGLQQKMNVARYKEQKLKREGKTISN
jgi:hypothetical protein